VNFITSAIRAAFSMVCSGWIVWLLRATGGWEGTKRKGYRGT
jgi:hypothetical protein